MLLAESIPFSADRYNELKRLVAQGEGLHLEFKRKATYPEKIVREMIALANTEGGIVLVGVNDDRTIPGLKHPEGEAHVIQKALRNVVPPLSVHEQFVPIGSARTVILYTIRESKRKPHRWVHASGKKESFVRIADQSHTASREVQEIYRRRSRSKGVHIRIGDFERTLLRQLEVTPTLSFEEVQRLTGTSRTITSQKLVILVLANVIRVTPREKGDAYSLAETFE